ncbi:four-carbon acid sugar kinase family protein (plasmid) [Croceibacterium sp. TMG7-5b_MA50]|uniref:four-carbon acid sugar kinase family protein n=1 Tax=Croceibacterium sp. TMG7-5b_MA50 TaxID=3121290 RepID=UPI003221E759
MNPIVIVADDLTGASDSAAPFAMRGASVRIALHVDAIAEAAAGDPAVLAVDTRSRHLPPAAAAERAATAWRALAPLAPRLVFKKVDSRLQGPCAAEVDSLLAQSGRDLAAICPAVPAQQRIVAGGLLAGRGLDRPIGVADHFAATACLCHDAGDMADLDAIAAGVLADPECILAVGASGLATALAQRLFGPAATAATPQPELPLLIAIGSRDAITDAQVQRLRHEYPDPKDTAVHLHRMPADPQPDPAPALARFAGKVADLVRADGVRTLLCSGGDTAAAVLDALAVRQLVPEGEWCAGIPSARVVGRPDLRLVTKSGGFGDPGVLARFVRHARTGQRQDAA